MRRWAVRQALRPRKFLVAVVVELNVAGLETICHRTDNSNIAGVF